MTITWLTEPFLFSADDNVEDIAESTDLVIDYEDAPGSAEQQIGDVEQSTGDEQINGHTTPPKRARSTEADSEVAAGESSLSESLL